MNMNIIYHFKSIMVKNFFLCYYSAATYNFYYIFFSQYGINSQTGC